MRQPPQSCPLVLVTSRGTALCSLVHLTLVHLGPALPTLSCASVTSYALEVLCAPQGEKDAPGGEVI